MLAFALKNWQFIAGALAIAALVILWQSDRHTQYLLGIADQKAATAELISKSRELTDHEKNSALDLATDAARGVCIEAGVDVKECDGL